jgi:hypothetical protein
MKILPLPALLLAAALLASGTAFANDSDTNSRGKSTQQGAAAGNYTPRNGGARAPVYTASGNGGAAYSAARIYNSRGFSGGNSRVNYGGSYSGNYSTRYGGNNAARYGGGYGGNGAARYGGGYNRGYGGNYARYTFAFGSHTGWNPGNIYLWHGRHYCWRDNGWFIIDYYPSPYYDDYPVYYPAPAPVASYDDNDDGGGNVPMQVQQALARQGYYHGPIDGVIGPVTHGAIEAYQRDNNLRATGTINNRLLDALDLD